MKKLSIAMLIMLLSFAFFTGCSNNGGSTEENETGTETGNTTVSGEIVAGGSTSTKNIMEATLDEFAALNPDVTAEYNATGSSDGVKNADSGVYQIGTASRNIKEEEKALGLTEKIFAYDGIAVIVNPANKVKDITVEQLAQIYKGEITNWKDLGGEDAQIVVVSREDGSGTRGAFEEIVGFEEELTANATIAEGNGNVQSTVAENENTIGYVSFTYINDTIKALTVEGVEATTDNVLNETYKVSRPFVMVYQDDNLNDAGKAYIEFLMGEEGQAIVEEEGGIPVK
ncbi:phosphate ABC transporter substrate-binding protein (PhoT family) [Alkalibaculum bacchi]|uniref:Phosphate-binding protein n=1 Tax=Alkalibaculum bacchi TaxID=645887 RepID=A0A366IDM1_9FIRM|nr:phosphate ABC transporter substrate-binding protein [Alkalibaculum bacchi]RBP68334.1 phosphate ABC transporter substrate-binding protein (PhoT family) [Alkalibaculum bacchi]